MKVNLDVCQECDNCWRSYSLTERWTCQVLSGMDGVDDTLNTDTEIPKGCPYKEEMEKGALDEKTQ